MLFKLVKTMIHTKNEIHVTLLTTKDFRRIKGVLIEANFSCNNTKVGLEL